MISFDFFLCGFTTWLAFGLRLDQWGFLLGNQWLVVIASIGLSIPLFIYFGFYRAIFRYIGSVVLASTVRVFIGYTGVFFFIFTLIGFDDIPRSIGVIQPILLFIGIAASRYFVRSWLGNVNNVHSNLRKDRFRVLIYGAGVAGRQLAAGLSTDNQMLVMGFIDDDPHLQGSTLNAIAVYPSAHLGDLIPKLHITDVLLALPSVNQGLRNEIITSLSGYGVRVRTLPTLIDISSGRVRVSDLHDLEMDDLLGRASVPPKVDLLEKNIRNQVVLVSGAGGSIGSELCRQIIQFSPKSIILLDSSEHSLYLIYEELMGIHNPGKLNDLQTVKTLQSSLDIKLVPCLASVRDRNLLLKIFRLHRPAVVFHAAAYKHVPLVEQNIAEGVRNNVFGTLCLAQVSLECNVSNFILVSTDKAVRPTNVMGASKRIAEMILQAMAKIASMDEFSTIFSMVRFGNVLGSSGSVAPLFSSQISSGGPITLTHPEVTRYFMTVPEAAQLVIQASSMAVGGDVFVLDMGDPVRIYDLAIRMIYLSGQLVKDDAHPYGDIEIKITGLRPGEKLYEELLIGNNPMPTDHPKIMKAHEEFLPWNDLQQELTKLNLALDAFDTGLIMEILKKLVPGYLPSGGIRS